MVRLFCHSKYINCHETFESSSFPLLKMGRTPALSNIVPSTHASNSLACFTFDNLHFENLFLIVDHTLPALCNLIFVSFPCPNQVPCIHMSFPCPIQVPCIHMSFPCPIKMPCIHISFPCPIKMPCIHMSFPCPIQVPCIHMSFPCPIKMPCIHISFPCPIKMPCIHMSFPCPIQVPCIHMSFPCPIKMPCIHISFPCPIKMPCIHMSFPCPNQVPCILTLPLSESPQMICFSFVLFACSSKAFSLFLSYLFPHCCFLITSNTGCVICESEKASSVLFASELEENSLCAGGREFPVIYDHLFLHLILFQ